MHRAWILIINGFLWSFFVVSSIILFLGAVIIRVLTTPFDRNLRLLHQYSCFWASLYIWINPLWRVRIKGLENVDRNKAYVMVSNHASMADIIVVFRSFLHFKWVSKKSMFKAPLLGWNMRLNKYVAIERGDASSREKCLQECREWIHKGSSVFFFPEGTRSKDGCMRPFKVGAFLLACQTGTDILPVVIRGSRDAIPKNSVLLKRKTHMTFEALAPIPVEKVAPDQVQEIAKQKAEETQAVIAAAFNP